MNMPELLEVIMNLPEAERLELARRVIASLPGDRAVSARIAEAVPGIEDIISAKVTGLNEVEFRAALK